MISTTWSKSITRDGSIQKGGFIVWMIKITLWFNDQKRRNSVLENQCQLFGIIPLKRPGHKITEDRPRLLSLRLDDNRVEIRHKVSAHAGLV